MSNSPFRTRASSSPVSYTHLRATVQLVKRLATGIDAMEAARDRLAAKVKGMKARDAQQEADTWYGIRTGEMARLRAACDRLEELVADSAWPMPGYSDLLYDL